MPSLELKKFNMKRIQFQENDASDNSKGPVIVLIGRRDTGKSILIKDIMYHHRSIPIGTVISGTEVSNDFFSKMVPKIFIHNEYNSGIIENVLKRQKMVLKLNKSNLHNKQDARTFTILDDCLYDDKWSRDKLMRLIFMNGRHWKIMLIISMQYPLGVPPVLRTNIDFVFILREPVRKNREKLYDNYAGMFPNFETFNQFMDKCTENYECLVIDNNVKSNKLEDQVYWYKADQHQDFQLGLKEYWDMSKNLNTDDEDDVYDPNMMRKKSQGPVINIKKVN
jgi:hypothetical protein